MKEKTEEFEKHLNTLSSINSDLKNRSEKMLEALHMVVGNQKTIMCAVCYSEPANCAFLPCGHAKYCETCAQRGLNRGKCYICRGRVQSFIKIYM